MDSIDYGAVRRYFDKAAKGASAAASYMAHDHDLPEAAARYRFSTELKIIGDWLDAAPTSAGVLDIGCGAGTWTQYFAQRYARVIGIEGSAVMAAAARERTAGDANVEILEADARAELPVFLESKRRSTSRSKKTSASSNSTSSVRWERASHNE